jgi:AcrR family transcriptional regulator
VRRLGTRLGVAAMSLYRHVPNRDSLLAAVVNHLFAEAVTERAPEGPWHEALTRFAVGYRRMLLVHPRAVPLLATHPVDIDTGIALMSGLLGRFSDSGIPQRDAVTAIQSVGVYVLGHALAQVGAPPGTDLAALDPAATEFYDQWFDAGLHAMVSGVERALGR